MHTLAIARSAALVALPLVFWLATPAYAQDSGLSDDAAFDAVDSSDPAAAADAPLSFDAVQSYQEKLKKLGYFHGPADGRKGPRTRLALRSFQRDEGLEASGSLDPLTLQRIDLRWSSTAEAVETAATPETDVAETYSQLPEPVESAPAAVVTPESTATTPETTAADPATAQPTAAPAAGPPPTRRSKNYDPGITDILGGAGKGVVAAGKAARTGVVTAGKAVGTAGEATADAGATAGKSVAKAGEATADASATAGKSVAKAGVAVADGSVYVVRKVGEGSTSLYGRTKRIFAGDDRTSDNEIRRAILSHYAGDDRIVAGEVDVQVYDGNVTLALPEGAHSDADHAARIARLVPGVKTVTTIYVAVVPDMASTGTR
jgi:peptidoglycan hydrolase-like protein with peptidoglycan-binding domain